MGVGVDWGNRWGEGSDRVTEKLKTNVIFWLLLICVCFSLSLSVSCKLQSAHKTSLLRCFSFPLTTALWLPRKSRSVGLHFWLKDNSAHKKHTTQHAHCKKRNELSTHMPVCAHTYIRMHACAHSHTYTCTHTHTHIHQHTRTHVHTQIE